MMTFSKNEDAAFCSQQGICLFMTKKHSRVLFSLITFAVASALCGCGTRIFGQGGTGRSPTAGISVPLGSEK